jgi:hypothetical protein
MNDTLTSPEAKMHRQLDPAHAAWEWKALLLLLLAVALLFSTHAFAAEAPQKTFVTPDEAVNALVAAVKADDAKAIRAVLGNDPGDLSSGDAVADGPCAGNSSLLTMRSTPLCRRGTRRRSSSAMMTSRSRSRS